MASASGSRGKARGKVRCVNIEFADNGVEIQQRHENPGPSYVPDPRPSVFDSKDAALKYVDECLTKYGQWETEHEA